MAGERWAKALPEFQERYRVAQAKQERSRLLDEFCRAAGYHRKYGIALLNGARINVLTPKRRRGPTYSRATVRAAEYIWEAAGYPWSSRLKASFALWLPWARGQVPGFTDEVQAQLLRISARQLDRRLHPKKRRLKRRMYGRTKPGTLLKHHIPIKTDHWDVAEPGYCEIDLVSHSGACASGEFIYSLNLTDIHTGWCETRAVMGRGEQGVVAALEEIRRALPFALKGIDSDNGSEFINHHLVRYCEERAIQFTRSRPYQKNDNAHIEQKNWTHVRRVFGWDRYDTPALLEAMNEIYRGELGRMMNLYQPSVKLIEKKRIGSKLCRRYDEAQTPLDRLLAHAGPQAPPLRIEQLRRHRQRLDPFALSRALEQHLAHITQLQKNGHKTPASKTGT
jgi:transposase InsO family protein